MYLCMSRPDQNSVASALSHMMHITRRLDTLLGIMSRDCGMILNQNRLFDDKSGTHPFALLRRAQPKHLDISE